jgi:hypothetical protein
MSSISYHTHYEISNAFHDKRLRTIGTYLTPAPSAIRKNFADAHPKKTFTYPAGP